MVVGFWDVEWSQPIHNKKGSMSRGYALVHKREAFWSSNAVVGRRDNNVRLRPDT